MWFKLTKLSQKKILYQCSLKIDYRFVWTILPIWYFGYGTDIIWLLVVTPKNMFKISKHIESPLLALIFPQNQTLSSLKLYSSTSSLRKTKKGNSLRTCIDNLTLTIMVFARIKQTQIWLLSSVLWHWTLYDHDTCPFSDICHDRSGSSAPEALDKSHAQQTLIII